VPAFESEPEGETYSVHAVDVRPVTVNVKLLLAVFELASWTVAVKVEDPALLGVPLIAPAVERLSPAGSEPELVDQCTATCRRGIHCVL